MRSIGMFFAALMLAGPDLASADVCDDLWFSRNQVFAEAGYCFGSELGQSVFGTERCIRTGFDLRADQKDFVARIRQAESQIGCAVDTTRSELILDLPELREALTDQPVASEFESACLNWLADPMPLYSGFGSGAFRWDQIEAGDDVYFAHEDEGDPDDPWTFVLVYRGEAVRTLGWTQFGVHDPSRCEGWAG